MDVSIGERLILAGRFTIRSMRPILHRSSVSVSVPARCIASHLISAANDTAEPVGASSQIL
jgi:hypothetical protein